MLQILNMCNEVNESHVKCTRSEEILMKYFNEKNQQQKFNTAWRVNKIASSR